MGWRRWVAAVFVAVFSLSGTAGAAENWIELRDGVKARFLTALKSTDPAQPKTLMVMFVLSNPALVADQSKVIEIADQLFGRVVLVAAEEKDYPRAIVNLLKSEKKVGADTVQAFEDFTYVRGGNGVWLREAGPEAWKVAQDPNWTPPQSETVQLSTGAVYIDYIGEIFAPAGVTKALGVELHSATPVANIPAKYTEIKEIWNRLDHTKVTQAGFDFVHIENYGEPLLGRFHVRKRVYLDITRQADGTWPVLPDTAPLKDGKEPLVAGVGLQFEDDATRFAARAVSSILPVSNRSDDVEGVTQGIAVSSRRLLTAPSALEFLTPKQ
ncbi:MAG: hypothetical protein ACKVRO_12360 [Micropepsaceae bacterium]